MKNMKLISSISIAGLFISCVALAFNPTHLLAASPPLGILRPLGVSAQQQQPPSSPVGQQLTTDNRTAPASMSDTFIAQNTATSKAGTLPIHQTHQLVRVLPPREDGKIWVGTVTWASSKPVEVEIWHFYNSSIPVDAAHGTPVITPYGNKTIAFTLIKQSSGTPLPSGSINFAGSELSFHTLDGSKFTVAYSVDAKAEKINH